jgi:hypothetical protein
VGNKRIRFTSYGKLFLFVLNGSADIKVRLTQVKTETLLYWQRTLLKLFWTFDHRSTQRGRKPLDTEVRHLILSMEDDSCCGV